MSKLAIIPTKARSRSVPRRSGGGRGYTSSKNMHCDRKCGIIVGSIFGGIIGLLLLFILFWCIYKKRQ